MKRILSLLFLICFAIPAFCQKLGYKTDNETILSIGTNYSIEDNLGIATEYHFDKKTKVENLGLAFIVTSSHKPMSFDKGSILLIKTFSGTVIQLEEYLSDIDVDHDQKKVSTMLTLYTAKPRYRISDSQFDTIIKEGIQKLRFDTTTGFVDYEFEHDKHGKILERQKSIIKEEADFSRGY